MSVSAVPETCVLLLPPRRRAAQNLDATTKHLMNKDRLNMMKKDAVLVNAARGPVIDEKALVVRTTATYAALLSPHQAAVSCCGLRAAHPLRQHLAWCSPLLPLIRTT